MRKALLGFTGLYLCFMAFGQKKPPLDHSVYDAWQRIGSRAISPDGNVLAYTVDPQEGDGMLYIVHLKTLKKDSVSRGTEMQFTPGSDYLIARIKAPYLDTRKAKIDRKKPEEMPKDSLLVYDLRTHTINTFAGLRSFAVPEKDRSVFIYHLETPLKDSIKTKKAEGSPLYLWYNPDSIMVFPGAAEYALDKTGKSLVVKMIQPARDSLKRHTVVLRHGIVSAIRDTLLAGNLDATQFTWDESGNQLAFLATRDSTGAKIKNWQLRYHQPEMDSASVRLDPMNSLLPEGMQVSNHFAPFFSEDGSRLFFGMGRIPVPEDTSVPHIDRVSVDIWHYTDDYLQTMQLKNLDQELKRTYLTLSLADGTWIPLGEEHLEQVNLAGKGNGRFALGRTDRGQRIPLQWEGDSKKDIYLIDLETGSKTRVIDDLDGQAFISPGGTYLIWYENTQRQYHTYHNPTGKTAPISRKIRTSLADEENDVPDDPDSYGICGWSEGDQWVYLYDRYDIWRCDPSGHKSPVNITNGLGREQKIQFRNVVLDPDEKYFKRDQVLLLSALRDSDKQRGFYRIALNDKKGPRLLTLGEYSYGPVVKARKAEVMAYTKGNFQNSPDIFTGSWFGPETKHSAINPQQLNYNWGSVDLIEWTTFKGKPGKGLLYKPEDFDPSKKYPMIVYFYEKLTDGRYHYIPPAPTPSRLNIPFFVSRGYLVLAPDITYEIGYPGGSAYDHVVSGVESLKKYSWLDTMNIALQGQSWGGYQALYIITRTNQFKAAWTGAPVVNMFSAYGGIRWESGRNRQMQYEKAQSRIGATPWQRRDLYIENSPLFYLDRVTTPIVIMANDADGAVPWYQGIELFTNLRRLGKKAWMLNYNGEAHNLRERKNQKDISVREQQFFDHFLKNETAPVWLEKGVPATYKGKTLGLGRELNN